MSTILITGGTGFIGANLCLHLVREGHRVICVDNNSTGRLEYDELSQGFYRAGQHGQSRRVHHTGTGGTGTAETGSRSRIVYRNLPLDDPAQRRPNIDLAREKLGWEPAVKLNEGLKRTIPYFKTHLVRFRGED